MADSLQLTRRFFQILLIIGTAALLNYLTAGVAYLIGLPFLIDTWATMTAVLIAGPVVGILAGILYALLFSVALPGVSVLTLSLLSAWSAIMLWLFHKAGWLKPYRFQKVLMAGLLTGLTAGLLLAFINSVGSTIALSGFFLGLLWQVIDKLLAVFIAVVVLRSLPQWIRNIRI